MNLKKLVLGITLICFIGCYQAAIAQNVPDSTVRSIISLYKAQNYTGCMQSAEKALKINPSNAYIQYYLGMSYMQLGMTEKATDAFNKVITLNTNKTLTKYAQKGVACIKSPETCGQDDSNQDELDLFIKSNKFYDKSVQTEVNKKKLDRIRENINDELGPQRKKSEIPSNEEIANAVKTLAKVGFNPMTGINYQNPEMMQMNMLLGNNDGYQNNGMNMLPFLLMSQNQNGSQKMSPELIQSMMMSQMQMY